MGGGGCERHGKEESKDNESTVACWCEGHTDVGGGEEKGGGMGHGKPKTKKATV